MVSPFSLLTRIYGIVSFVSGLLLLCLIVFLLGYLHISVVDQALPFGSAFIFFHISGFYALSHMVLTGHWRKNFGKDASGYIQQVGKMQCRKITVFAIFLIYVLLQIFVNTLHPSVWSPISDGWKLVLFSTLIGNLFVVDIIVSLAYALRYNREGTEFLTLEEACGHRHLLTRFESIPLN